MPSLAGKVALIVGAGREPARTLALALAAQGVGLALSDLTPMAMEETAALAGAYGVRVTCHVADPSKGLAVGMLVDEVLEAWDSLDILVMYPRAEPNRSFLALDEWNWQRTLETNLNGPFLLMQLVARTLREEGRAGVFITLIASGEEARRSAAFHTSQAGLRALVQAAARELAADGMRVYGMMVADAPEAARSRVGELAVELCSGANDPAGAIFDLGANQGEA